MATVKFPESFFQEASEVIQVKRLDAKHPDQSRPTYTDVGGSRRAIVQVDFRQGTLESKKGLDNQGFIYQLILKNDEASDIENKDVIVLSANDTELHVIEIEPLKLSVYTLCICSNIQDPNVQKRRK